MRIPLRSFLGLPLLLLLGAGCPAQSFQAPAGFGKSTSPGNRARPETPGMAQLRRRAETICDRIEDCAIERNESLARTYGGTAQDITMARHQARRALHSGLVRRWCLLRLSGTAVKQIQRIHGCLSNSACDPFYKCADFAKTPRLNPRRQKTSLQTSTEARFLELTR